MKKVEFEYHFTLYFLFVYKLLKFGYDGYVPNFFVFDIFVKDLFMINRLLDQSEK